MTLTIEETRDIPLCRDLRRQVFCVEQGISQADELDGCDDIALHFIALESGHPVGTARVVISGSTAKIGRVCVLISARRRGIATKLIRAALDRLRHLGGIAQATLGAQISAQGLYAALGFRPEGAIFDDVGIPHQEMVLDLH